MPDIVRLYSEKEKAEAVRKYKDDWEWHQEEEVAVHKPSGLEVTYGIKGRNEKLRFAYYTMAYGNLWNLEEGCKNDREFLRKIKKITRQFMILEQAGCFPELTEEEKHQRSIERRKAYEERKKREAEEFKKFYAVHGEEYEIWRRIKGLEFQIKEAQERRDEKLVKIKQEEKRRLEEEFKKAQAATAARLKASGQNQGR